MTLSLGVLSGASAGRAAQEHRLEVKSGTVIPLGFMVDDSDQPDADVQHWLAWPPTHSTSTPPDEDAQAVQE